MRNHIRKFGFNPTARTHRTQSTHNRRTLVQGSNDVRIEIRAHVLVRNDLGMATEHRTAATPQPTRRRGWGTLSRNRPTPKRQGFRYRLYQNTLLILTSSKPVSAVPKPAVNWPKITNENRPNLGFKSNGFHTKSIETNYPDSFRGVRGRNYIPYATAKVAGDAGTKTQKRQEIADDLSANVSELTFDLGGLGPGDGDESNGCGPVSCRR